MASYILRFDDLCASMNWDIWDRIESLLDEYGIKPIIAVIPDCKDPKLQITEPNPVFWSRVKGWQAKGYTIALHGYDHVYTNKRAGILGITRQSEYVGKSYQEQKVKIQKGLSLFQEHGVQVKWWIAPSHSFDVTTIKVLQEFGIQYISDGFGTRPFNFLKMSWMPCQLWEFKDQPDDGIYTVCYHHNKWSEGYVLRFRDDIINYKERIVDTDFVIDNYAFGTTPFVFYRTTIKNKLKNIAKNILKR